jgi:hypothetical protein
MKTSQSVFRNSSKAHACLTFLLLSLVISATVGLAGCAAVVSGTAPQTQPPATTPLTITVSSLPAATAQTAYSATLSATGATAPYSWSMTAGSLPSGLTMSASGQIAGMPTQATNSSFTVQVTDSSTPAKSTSASMAITVKPVPTTAVQISTTSLPGGQVSKAYTTTMAATGGAIPYSWTLGSGQLPAGLALNAVTGVISGTPSQAGTFAFTVNLADSSSPAQTAVANLSIAIAVTIPPLQVTTTALPAGETGSAYSAVLAATGGTTPYAWSVSAGALPDGLTLSTAGQISGTPTKNGSFPFTLQVKDSSSPVATTTQALSISISLTGGPLQVTTVSLPNGQGNVAYSTTMTAIGGTKPYSWTVSAGSLPTGLTLNSNSGIISGTPTQSGSFALTIQVKDSAASPQAATKALNLTVAAAVTPVQISTSSLAGGQVGANYAATLTASGGTKPYVWSISSGSLPAGLTLNAATGQIGGTPTTTGTPAFTVKVTDSNAPAQTASANLSIAVAAAVPPVQVVTSSLAGGQVSAAYSATLAASGGKTPYSWSMATGTLPAGLTLTGAGQISGTPTTAGTASFTVKVTDSSAPAKTATQSLSLVIAATSPALTVTPASVNFANVTVGSSGSQTIQLSNTGGSVLTITKVTTTGTGFSMGALVLPLSINPGKSSTFNVQFAPATPGGAAGSVSILSNAPTSPTGVTLNGNGVAATHTLSFSATSLDFGNVNTGSTATKGVTITNTGNANVTISQISITGTGFSLSGAATPVTLTPTQTTMFSVVFSPTAPGSPTGTVTVTSNATGSPVQISLSGTGVQQVAHTVALNWTASTSTVSGYNVYRSTVSGSGYTKLNSSLVAAVTYSDATVQNSQTYFYVTTAVDANGDESSFSNEVQLAIP